MSKTFEFMQQKEQVIMVVDAINLAFRYKHSGATDFCEDYIRTVKSLQKSYKATWVILACDHGSSTFRRALYPEYKQNRKDKQDQQTDAERVAFEIFIEEFNRTIAHIQQNEIFTLLRFRGVEADDIAAYIVNKCSNLDSIEHIWLISSDKDWDLLVGPKVSRFSYVTRKEVTGGNWSQHYDFSQEDYVSIKALMGDAGDNIIGVPSIGPKRAKTLVDQYGSALDIVANIPISGNYKYIQELNKCSDLIMLNSKLVDLVTYCEDAIGEENLRQINSVLQNINILNHNKEV